MFASKHRPASTRAVAERLKRSSPVIPTTGRTTNSCQRKSTRAPPQQAGHGETVRLLLRLGAKVDARNELRSTSLMLATLGGKADVAALLVDNGADVDAQSSNGLTSLMLAAASREQSSLETVKLLIAHSSDLNIADDNGRTALMYSILSPPPPPPPPSSDNVLKRWYRDVADRRGIQTEIASLLIKAGSKLSAKDREGNTAESLAKAYQQHEILELLRAASQK